MEGTGWALGREPVVAASGGFVYSSFVLEGQRPRGECHQAMETSWIRKLSWRDVPPSTRAWTQRYVIKITPAWCNLGIIR